MEEYLHNIIQDLHTVVLLYFRIGRMYPYHSKLLQRHWDNSRLSKSNETTLKDKGNYGYNRHNFKHNKIVWIIDVLRKGAYIHWCKRTPAIPCNYAIYTFAGNLTRPNGCYLSKVGFFVYIFMLWCVPRISQKFQNTRYYHFEMIIEIKTLFLHHYIYIYIYLCVCVCLCKQSVKMADRKVTLHRLPKSQLRHAIFTAYCRSPFIAFLFT